MNIEPYPAPASSPRAGRFSAALLALVALIPTLAHAQFFHAAVKKQQQHSPTAGMAAAMQASAGDNQPPFDPDVLYAGKLRVKFTSDYDIRLGTGAGGIPFWRPRLPQGYARVGDVMAPDIGKTPVLIVEDNPLYVAKPVRFELVWGDNWDNQHNASTTVWYPVPPEGFEAIGMVAQTGNTPPDTSLYRCVKKDLLIEGKYKIVGLPYNGIGGTRNPTLWIARYTLAPKDDTAVICANTLWFSWWDGNHEPTGDGNMTTGSYTIHPPRVPDFTRPGGVPSRQLITGWMLRAASHDQVKADTEAGLKAVYGDRLLTVAASGSDALKKATALSAPAVDSLAKEIDRVRAGAANAKSASVEKFAVPGRPPAPVADTTGAPSSFTPAPAAQQHTLTSGPEGAHSLGDVQLAGTTFPLGMRDGFKDIPGLKNVQITGAQLIQGTINNGLPEQNKNNENGQSFAIVTGKITLNLNAGSGQVSVSGDAYALTRLYAKDGLRTGVLVIVPADQLGKLVPTLGLKVSQAAILFGSERHTWLTGDIAGSGIPAAVSNALKPFATAAHGLHFSKRTMVIFRAGIGELKLDNILTATPPEMLFTGIFPEKTTDTFKLISEPVGAFKLTFLPRGMDLGAPRIELIPGAKTIGLSAPLSVDTLGVKFQTQIGITTDGTTLTLSGNLPGQWKSPAGVPELALDHMTIDGSFGGMGPGHLGLGGTATFLGKTAKLDGTFSLFAPMTLTGVKVSGLDLSLHDLVSLEKAIASSAGGPDSPTLPPGNLIEIRGATFSAASENDPHLGITRGTVVKGDLYIKGSNVASVDAHFSGGSKKNVQIQADLKNFSLGPITVGGSPHIDILYTPSMPYLEGQHCIVRGTVDAAGAKFASDVALNRTGIQVNLDGQVAGSHVTIVGQGDNVFDAAGRVNEDQIKAMVMRGSLSGKLINDLAGAVTEHVDGNDAVATAMKIFGGAIFKVRGVEFAVSYADLAADKAASVTVHCTIFGSDVSVGSDSLKLSEITPDKLKGVLGDRVIEAAGKFGGIWTAAFDAVKDLAVKKAQEVADNFKKASEVANEAINTSTAELSNLTTQAQHAAEKALDAAKKAIEDIGNAIAHVFGH